MLDGKYGKDFDLSSGRGNNCFFKFLFVYINFDLLNDEDFN